MVAGRRSRWGRTVEVLAGLHNVQFRWFLAGQTCWFAAFGVQAVLFPFLVVSVLHESPERVGLAQMCVMLPALALMVPGGMMADAMDLRSLISRLQLATMAPVAVLAASMGLSELTFAMVVMFALAHGSLQAMVTPTRDALLGRIAEGDVQKAITTAMAVQFISQMLGFGAAGLAGTIGPVPLLVAQAVLYALAGVCALQMSPLPPLVQRSAKQSPLAELSVAAAQVLHSSKIAPVVLIMVGVGFCFIGEFSVIIPIMVRDNYAGGSTGLALINIAFVFGLISATLTLRRLPPIKYQGRAIFSACCGGALLTALFGLAPPLPLFYLFIYLFGIGAGITMSIGRTIVQEAASPAHRAQVLAIYSLTFLGSAPIGSFAIGQIAAAAGVTMASYITAGVMAALLLGVITLSGVWRVQRET